MRDDRFLYAVPKTNDDDTKEDLVLTQTISKYDDWFQKLWHIYPRHVARLAALNSFKRIKPDLATCRTIAADITRRKANGDWCEDRKSYIPHFSTYLNQRRWEDEE